jgi:tetratricopeptide (TPR) repeat protein
MPDSDFLRKRPQRVSTPFDLIIKNKIRGKTEWAWYTILKKLIEKTTKGKSGVDMLQEFYNQISTEYSRNKSGERFGKRLSVKYERSENHPEARTFRAIEAFARKRGDCDELAYLFLMMGRIGMVKNSDIMDLLVGDVHVAYNNKPVSHTCAAIFIKGEKPEGTYVRFEEDKTFRKKTLAKTGLKDSPDLHLILVDLVNPKGFGVQHKEVDILTDKESTAFFHSQSGLTYVSATKRNPNKAIKECKIALDIMPDNADAHLGLGLAYEAVGDIPIAVKHYKKAIVNYRKMLRRFRKEIRQTVETKVAKIIAKINVRLARIEKKQKNEELLALTR